MRESLLGAGIMRLRPVMITVGATIMALVPVNYSFFMLDLKIISWQQLEQSKELI